MPCWSSFLPLPLYAARTFFPRMTDAITSISRHNATLRLSQFRIMVCVFINQSLPAIWPRPFHARCYWTTRRDESHSLVDRFDSPPMIFFGGVRSAMDSITWSVTCPSDGDALCVPFMNVSRFSEAAALALVGHSETKTDWSVSLLTTALPHSAIQTCLTGRTLVFHVRICTEWSRSTL